MSRIVLLFVGVILGAAMMWSVMADLKQPECIIGQVELSMPGTTIQIGEAVVCGEFHSDIYGPSIEAWSGEIKFYHGHEEE